MSRRGGLAFLFVPLVVTANLGSPKSADWRENVRTFAEAHLQHTAWAHARRDYAMTLALVRPQGTVVDTDALHAAA